MSLIFVDTDNTQSPKLFSATMIGAASGKGEAAMCRAVKAVFDSATGFTTKKESSSRGYTLRLKVDKVDKGPTSTKCFLSGSIARYPKEPNAKGEMGEIMVSTSATANGRIDGTSEADVIACVAAVAGKFATDSIGQIKIDDAKR